VSERKHAQRCADGYGSFRFGLWIDHSGNKFVCCRIGRGKERVAIEPAQFLRGEWEQ